MLFAKLYCVGLLLCVRPDTARLTLAEVVELARQNSIDAKQAITVRKTKYWQYRTYRSNYQPQLSMTGVVPGYSKTYTQVLQPNGTILFQPVYQDNASLTLNFSQTIAATGGTIYGETQLQQFNDFKNKVILYNGVPYAIGYSQPLFQYNSLRWDNRIEPLKYRESKQAYIEAQEKIAIAAEGYFFDLLLAQVNLRMAETNRHNTEKILGIARIKYDLGKVSKNEILQLQLEQLNTEKAEGTARRDLEIATLTLRTYTGEDSADNIVLSIPDIISDVTISTDKVLDEAYANRSDAIAFVRRIAEARRDVALAKGQNGLTATLTANLGYSNTGPTVPDVYHAPQDQQLLQLQFNVPILDWGRSKARARTAEANEQLVEYTVEQDKQTFKQQIVTQVSLFNVMKDQVGLTARADSIAAAKYEIARQRYVLGDLSITDLSIAFQENDQAQRDYIGALRDFWGAYYQLRYLSLYDFEKNEKITYK
ncbi:TolC family protein [Dinghuibacter silviterrae]|uniref:Outer membrane protein TolC n=1 Tax=Dinghuibacter silviterrae TaxID=1539049 RepID=A0A4R8DRT8_9BACT|nr:TolC family protein [Dinghuibacter silviterrae]TDX00556.1 outer membrane protein TolC [Dinghuibacter silviterrae]